MRFDLTPEERVHYRDRLRTARYSALADAEGFSEICFVVEALGMRMLKQQATLGDYKGNLVALAGNIRVMKTLANDYPGCFSQFHALCETLNKARNDAMHTGAYARHATYAAIELCIHLEEAVMAGPAMDPQEDLCSMKVRDLMVKEVVSLQGWHPVAYARKLMLMHSFSFLPVWIENDWKLVSEMSVASFLRNERKKRLAMPICEAVGQNEPLSLEKALQIRPDQKINDLYSASFTNSARLWLVTESDTPDRLLGVLSPFELL